MMHRMHRFAATLGALAALALAATSLAATAPTTPPSAVPKTPSLQAHPAGTHAPHAAAAASAQSAPGAAQSATPAVHREYYIELVIFRALKTLGSPEDWQAELHMAPHVSGSESPTGTGVGHLVHLVAASGYKLTPIWNALQTSADYKPVAHVAWIQTASDWGTHAGFNLSELGVHVPGLTGLVYFERGTYLHLGLTLDYTMQHPPAGLDAPPGTTFVMNETRRVKFYERNYYDHPAFGVIALVLPVHHTH